MVSHDLRQPLCSIQVCTELLGLDKFAPAEAELIETIKASAHLANNLVDEILQNSPSRKVNALMTKRKKSDILALIRRCILTNEIIAANKKISLVLKMAIQKPSLEVLVDPVNLER